MTVDIRTKHKGGAGDPTLHDSAYGHVDGGAIYIDDMPEPRGCLHAHLVTSRWARARITKIDASMARTMPGVRAIATVADIKGENEISASIPGEALLPPEFVEYVGHPVAVVAADTEEQARRAAEAVVVEAEPLPAVLTVREALEKQQWVLPPMLMKRGDDPGPTIAKAPRRFQGEIEVGGQDHFYLEGQVALAIPQEGGMEVWSSTQHPSEVQHMVARILGLPQSAVTTLVRRMGGGFGGKESQATHDRLLRRLDGIDDRSAGQAAPRPRRRHDRHRQAPPVPAAMGRGHRRGGAHPRRRHADRRQCRLVDRPYAGRASRALSHADNAYYFPHVRACGAMAARPTCNRPRPSAASAVRRV